MRRFTSVLGVVLLALGCGGDGDDAPASPDGSGAQPVVDAGAPSAAADTLRPDPNAPPATSNGKKLYTVRFDSRAGEQPFACGKSAALGTKATLAEPIDMRFYVHDVTLVRANGERVALDLFQDERYQRANVALLDFADDTGKCATGDSDIRNVVHGYAPEQADYTAIAFKLGVPPDKNHLNAAEAPAPFSASGLWWSWSGGFKYARIDIVSGALPGPWFFHGGSTDCSGTTREGFTCKSLQIAKIELPNYNPQSSLVVFDAARFYAASDITVGDDTPGCMGFAPDTQCAPLYRTLGLTAWDDTTPGPQQTAFVLKTGAALVASKGTVAATRKTTDPTAWPDPTYQRPSALDVENVSKAGEKKSHPPEDPRYGQNCMRCHQAQGPGVGKFTAAGTLQDAAGKPAVGAKVEIFSATVAGYAKFENLVSRAILDVDANGNFFTTAPLPVDAMELGARLLGANGQPVLTMPFTQQTLACNNCHTGSMHLALPAVSP